MRFGIFGPQAESAVRSVLGIDLPPAAGGFTVASTVLDGAPVHALGRGEPPFHTIELVAPTAAIARASERFREAGLAAVGDEAWDAIRIDAGIPAQGRELGRDIRFVQVQTEHDAEPRVEGRAYLYFWPGGGTERASIQITRPGDLDGLTILVDALTGRARLRRGRIELEEARRDVDFQEREEQ